MDTDNKSLETVVRTFAGPILHEALNEELKNPAMPNGPAAEVRELEIPRRK
jgi:hypothetical protein